MAAWSGFTDDDLRRMKKSSQEDEGRPRVKKVARQPRSKAQRPKTDKSAEAEVDANSHVPSEVRLVPQSKTGKDEAGVQNVERKTDVCQHTVEGEKPERDEAPRIKADEEVKEVKELDEEQGISVELDNAIKFQQQQKVIEEANKQKRALLSKAIEERRKKAKAESAKLVKIQRELAHLDSLLTADVGIIRDKIEMASLDYVQAQKRYEKAEKEFIEAKMELFEKGENKERLTEHLYTIIHQNEMRKAKKLVELMEQLAMEVSVEEMEMSLPSIPPLTNFNAVTTLHQPGRRESESEDKNAPKKGDQPSSNENCTVVQPNDVSLEPVSTEEKRESQAPPISSESQPSSGNPTSATTDNVKTCSKEDRTDANQNNVNEEKLQNGANQMSSKMEEVNTIQTNPISSHVSQVCEENRMISSDAIATSPSTCAATLSATQPTDSLVSISTSEQSKQPKEEKPAKDMQRSDTVDTDEDVEES